MKNNFRINTCFNKFLVRNEVLDFTIMNRFLANDMAEVINLNPGIKSRTKCEGFFECEEVCQFCV